jgi:subfamily B ATP-binding cassette protein MsbA
MPLKLTFGLPQTARVALARVLRETVPPRLGLYLLSVALMICVAAFTGALAYMAKLIINDVFASDDVRNAWYVGFAVMAVAGAKSVSLYANDLVAFRFKRSISAEYKKRQFDALIAQDPGHAGDAGPSAIMARLRVRGEAAGEAVINLTNRLFVDALTVAVLIGVMIAQDPLMSLLGATLFPLIFWLIGRLTLRIRAVAHAEATLEGAWLASGTEALAGHKTVKTYALEPKTRARHGATVDAFEAQLYRIEKNTAAAVPIMEFLGGITLGLFVIYAAWQVLGLGKTPGEFTAFIAAFLLAYQPAERLSKTWVALQKGLVHVEALFETLDMPPPAADGLPVPAGVAALVFDDLSFAYGGDGPALRNVSLTIAPGERVAVVGRSGAGKSTLVDLVLGFRHAQTGRLLWGETDLARVAPAHWRDRVALISQDVFLFEGTIRDNIRDGRPDATDAQIDAAARAAAVSDFTDALPQGLDTPIGLGGAGLSGGQRQRLAIARALVKGADLVVFDEATSALDGESEAQVMARALAHLRGASAIFVTHRASTLRWMDRVVLLQAGRVVDADTPDALQARRPEFRALFQMDTLG